MKVGGVGGPGRASRVARTYAKGAGRVAAPQEVASVPAAEPVTADLFGIPESEFTPHVRDAIMTLMHEVDRLRQDVQAANRRVEDAARAADQDMLLPVLNRRAFVRELSRFIAFAERYGTPSSLLFFDLNNFKPVNDTYGHAAGDAVLKHFAESIATQVRDSDVVARLGGDEFGVILAHVSPQQATKKADAIAHVLRTRPPQWRGKRLTIGFSYGVYELRAGESADTAMAHADQAMYAQKRSR
jgi:diguanylate cyclase (GGDEF)-like protein